MVLHHPLTSSQFIICEAAQLPPKHEKRRGGGSLGSALTSAANFLLPPQVMVSLHFNLITHTPHSYLPSTPSPLQQKRQEQGRRTLKQSPRSGGGPQTTPEVRCEWSSGMNGDPTLRVCGPVCNVLLLIREDRSTLEKGNNRKGALDLQHLPSCWVRILFL